LIRDVRNVDVLGMGKVDVTEVQYKESIISLSTNLFETQRPGPE